MVGYRADGQGRAAHDPAMMVALLLYAYAIGERSSRRIERRCMEDVALRVIRANQAPDHTTIARFRQRHETALAELFGEVLALCAEAGLVKVGVIAIDGTKVHANASQHANRDYEQIAREILAEADAVDRARGRAVRRARAATSCRRSWRPAQGRRGWLREAKRRLDERRAEEARPIPAHARPAREAKRRLEEELEVECRANAAYEAYRARGVMKDGRRFGRPPEALPPPETPAGQDQRDRPGLAQRQDLARLDAGLQRPGRRQRAADRDRRRGDRRLTGLRAPRSRWSTPPSANSHAAGINDAARGRARGRRLLAPGADGSARRSRDHGADPARRRQAQGRPAGLGRRPLRVHAPRAGHRARRRSSTPSAKA